MTKKPIKVFKSDAYSKDKMKVMGFDNKVENPAFELRFKFENHGEELSFFLSKKDLKELLLIIEKSL